MSFRIYKDTSGYWRWSYRSTNGNVIADSGEGYVNRSDCLRGIQIMKDSLNAPVYQ